MSGWHGFGRRQQRRPIEFSGTSPSQAEKPRPRLNSVPLPMAETIAVAAGSLHDADIDFIDLTLQLPELPLQLRQQHA